MAPPELDRLFGAPADPTRRDIVRRAIAGEWRRSGPTTCAAAAASRTA